MKRVHTLYLFISACLLNAQTITISGTYLDKKSNPIDSATVKYFRQTALVDCTFTSADGGFSLEIPTLGIGEQETLIRDYNISQNWPNPFNPATKIIVATLSPGKVAIYNLLGREVDRIELSQPGEYLLSWGGGSREGVPLSAGLYFYTLQAGAVTLSRKMIQLDRGSGTPLRIVSSSQQGNSRALGKTLTVDAIHFSKPNTSSLEVQLAAPMADTSLGTTTGNVGPVLIGTLADTVIFLGDTLLLNLNRFIYNDDDNVFMPADSLIEMVVDTLLRYIAASPDTAEVKVYVRDGTDAALQDSLTFTIHVPFINHPPLIVAVSAADTLDLPPPEIITLDTVRATVVDEEGPEDISEVGFLSVKPDGILANNGQPIYLADNGQLASFGDVVAGDGIYSRIIQLSSNAMAGTYVFRFFATDCHGALSDTVDHHVVVLGGNSSPAQVADFPNQYISKDDSLDLKLKLEQPQ